MLKNQNGVTVAALVVTIIVLGILASVTISVTTDLMTDSKVKTYITNMLLVQGKAESLYEKYEFEGTSDNPDADIGNEYMGTKTDLNSLETFKKYLDGTNNDKYWYKWTQNTLSNNGLDPEMLTSGSEYYLVNYESGEVIYSKGFKGEGSTTYYTLTEMQSYSN